MTSSSIDLAELSVDGLRSLLTSHSVAWTDDMAPSELMDAARKAGIHDPSWGHCAEVIEFDDDDNVVESFTMPLKRRLSVDGDEANKKPRADTTVIKVLYASRTNQFDCWHVSNSAITHAERVILNLVNNTCLLEVPDCNSDAQKAVLHFLGVSNGEGGVTDSEWTKWDQYACDEPSCAPWDVLMVQVSK